MNPSTTRRPASPENDSRAQPIGPNGIATLVVLGTLLSACITFEPRDTSGVRIVNTTNETVTVYVDYPTLGERELITYEAGQESTENNMLGGECTELEMVARTQDGEIIDRQSPPTCRGETWEISDS